MTTIDSPLIAKAEWAQGLHTLAFAWKQGVETPNAGQFFMLKPTRSSVFLARPVSVFGASGGVVSFLLAARGAGTRELAAMNVGDMARLTGPLGATFGAFLPEEARVIALVAGGVGMAPLSFFADECAARHSRCVIDFYAGFKTSASIILPRARGIRALTIATEDGSGETHQGLITDYFNPAGYDAVFTCGPEAMMRAVAVLCEAAGVLCVASLERRMACGVGACLGCAVPTPAGNKRCCADGPVFAAGDVFQ
jgi:NAD(P)H-flavin reductase